jgi:hypothetical protein
LFQYGSNMARERFMRRIEEVYDSHAPPGTSVVVNLLGPARLDGWRVFANLWSASRACRVLNIQKDAGGEVWGALYEITAALVIRCDGERSVVDRLEGHRTTRNPENYAKVCVTVDLRGEPTRAWTYIGLREAVERCERERRGTRCNADYLEDVSSGAVSTGINGAYIEELRERLIG